MIRIPFPTFGPEDAADDEAPDVAAQDEAPEAAEPPDDEAAHADAQHEAKRADTAVVDRVDALLDGGEHPFMAAERDEAVRRAPEVLGRIKGIVEEARQRLTPAARAQFDQLYAGHRLPEWDGRVQAHVAGQDRADRDAVSAARRGQALAVTRASLVSDPARAEAGLAIALGEDNAIGARNGRSPDQIAEAQRRTRADALADGLEHAIHSRADLAEAQRRHDALRAQLDPARSDRIDAALHRFLADEEAARIAAGLVDGSIGLDGQGPRDLDAVQAAARTLAGADPVRREAYAHAIAERWSAEEAAREAARRKPIGELQPHLLNPEVRAMADLPRGLVAALPDDAHRAARDFYAAGGRFPARSDPMTAFRLAQMRAHDPEGFAQAHPTPHALSLSRDDYQALLADQDAARAGTPQAQAGQLAARRLLAVGRHALLEAAGRDAADDPEVAAGFHAQLQDAVALYRHAHDGQAPDDDQLDRMAAKLAERAKAGGAAEGGWQTAAYVHPAPDPFADGPDRSLFMQTAGPGGRPPLSEDEIERRVLQRLAERAHNPFILYDPKQGTLVRPTFSQEGGPEYRPLSADELQVFKEQQLGADSHRPGLKSPQERFVDAEVEGEKRTPPRGLAGLKPTDETTLARMIFAESARIPEDHAAIGWSIVNRVGDREFGATLDDVLNQKNAYQIVEKGGGPKGGSPLWKASANPAALTGDNARSWATAKATARGIMDRSIPDPTGGGTFFFSAKDFDGQPENAPRDFQRMLKNKTIQPSAYKSGSTKRDMNYFFVETKSQK